MKEKEEFDLESMKKKALEQLRSGQSLYGKDGAFAPLLKHFLESALESELDNHLDESERSQGNRKNGKVSKRLKTSSGTLDLETSRDRLGNFEPELIKKRETVLAVKSYITRKVFCCIRGARTNAVFRLKILSIVFLNNGKGK